MNILITGADGFIGQATCKALQETPWKLFKTSRSPREDRILLRLEYLSDFASLSQGPRMNAIVHLASEVNFQKGLEDLFVPNIAAVSQMLLLAKQWDAHLIFTSSISIFGPKETKISQTSLPCPTHPYSQSKWYAEQLITASGVKACILRLPGVFGKNGPSHLTLNKSIKNVLKQEVPTLIGTGLGRRNYIYVSDVAKAIQYALEHSVAGTHLLGGPENLSISEMLATLCEVFIPKQFPQKLAGLDSLDQLIEPSPIFPSARNFRDALLDIQSQVK